MIFRLLSPFVAASIYLLSLSTATAVERVPPSAPSTPPAAGVAGAAASAGLVDGDGRPYEGRLGAGAWQLLYFGYTHCADICPTTLFEMTAALDLLPDAVRPRVTPVFVTLDPERDTAAAMKAYVAPLGHGLVTVTGPREAVDRFAWAHEIVVIRRVEPGGGDTLDHTSSVLLVAPDGRTVERFPYEMDYREVARRIGDRLVAAPRP